MGEGVDRRLLVDVPVWDDDELEELDRGVSLSELIESITSAVDRLPEEVRPHVKIKMWGDSYSGLEAFYTRNKTTAEIRTEEMELRERYTQESKQADYFLRRSIETEAKEETLVKARKRAAAAKERLDMFERKLAEAAS